MLERFTCGACDEPFDGKAAIVWPPLAQPFTDNLMDEILRSMSDEELERLTAKNLPGEAGRRPAVSRRRMAHSGTAAHPDILA